MTPTKDSNLISRSAVARLLGVSPHTIMRMTQSGQIPAIRFNKRLIRYDPVVVQTFIKGKAGQ